MSGSSSFSSPATSRHDYSNIESDLSNQSYRNTKTNSSFLTSTTGSAPTFSVPKHHNTQQQLTS